ncbi:MAG TPA: hypothetical protein DEP28_04120 [Bacteroidetes bacterium]|nr:hypothetical protein [Bacteroidota bacterium]
MVSRYLLLKSYNQTPSFIDELEIVEEFYVKAGELLIDHNCINPTKPKNDPLIKFYSEIRPDNWDPKTWII